MAVEPEGGPGVGELGLTAPRLEDLIDRDALPEVAASFERLFHVPVRFVAASGTLLGEAGAPAELCGLVGESTDGRRACDRVIDEVRRIALRADSICDHACFTGARYRVLPLVYDGRVLGRVVLGPLRATEAPSTLSPGLLEAVPELDLERAAVALPRMPSLDAATATALGDHLAAVLDLIFFSGQKALFTSTMHVASIRESYRELEEKNAKLEDAYEKLRELDRLKSNFLATISHELRTPLTSIMGYGEMLAEGIGGPLTAEQGEFVQTIQQKSEQLLGLIMSLLDLSKLESGTALMRRSEVELAKLLGDTVTTLLPTAARKGVALAFEVAPDVPPLYADGPRLRQVFLNLAENAIKFTEAGGSVLLTARVAMAQPADDAGLVLVAPLQRCVEIRVVDTGAGIPEAERTKVFDAFYQVDQTSTREHGGAGLGLAIVKRLVDAHLGTIRVEPNEPRGTTFVVTLPLVRASSMPPPAFSEPRGR
jgi:signal transduction histidine kinase